jgi:hypothetical protein
MSKTLLLSSGVLLIVMLFSRWNATSASQSVVKLDPHATYQTIIGWEATAQAGHVASPLFPNYKDSLYDQAVNDLGINRLRLEVRAASANGFNLPALDFEMTSIVLPMSQRLEARGETLFLSVCVVGSDYADDPNGYAQAVLATYQHMERTYGFVPNAWEVALEPDSFGWKSAAKVAAAMMAAGNLLKANNYPTYFIAPSNTNMGGAVRWFDQITQIPGAAEYLKEFAYHRYSGVSELNLLAISSRASHYGIKTGMLEHIGSGYHDLHQDLKIGMNSAWQQYTLAFPAKGDNGAQYYWINERDPTSPIKIGSKTKFLRQYFRFVRSGAVRIQAASSGGDIDPLAFVNGDGMHIVILKSAAESLFLVEGLPPGTYGRRYTTPHAYDVDAGDVVIGSGEAAEGSLPAAGVMTIYGKIGADSGAGETAARLSPGV